MKYLTIDHNLGIWSTTWINVIISGYMDRLGWEGKERLIVLIMMLNGVSRGWLVWLAGKDTGGQERSHGVIKRDEMRSGDYRGEWVRRSKNTEESEFADPRIQKGMTSGEWDSKHCENLQGSKISLPARVKLLLQLKYWSEMVRNILQSGQIEMTIF